MTVEGPPVASPAPASNTPAPALGAPDSAASGFLQILAAALDSTAPLDVGESVSPAQAAPARRSPPDTTADHETALLGELPEEIVEWLAAALPPAPVGTAPPASVAPAASDNLQPVVRAPAHEAAALQAASDAAPADILGTSDPPSLAAATGTTATPLAPPAADVSQLVSTAPILAVTPLHAGASRPSAATGQELQSPVGTRAWAGELADRLVWMTHQGRESASLRLTPEYLGPIEIRIDVQDGEARVWFGATHADTRTALEQALPRLRELFAAEGMTLADAGVSHERSDRQPPLRADSAQCRAGDEDAAQSVTHLASARAGLVDTYA